MEAEGVASWLTCYGNRPLQQTRRTLISRQNRAIFHRNLEPA